MMAGCCFCCGWAKGFVEKSFKIRWCELVLMGRAEGFVEQSLHIWKFLVRLWRLG